MGDIRVGTRASQLAMKQAQKVCQWLESWAGLPCKLVPIPSRADRSPHLPLSQLKGEGLFVKELQQGLLEGSVDLAVHSLKDLPLAEPEGIALAAVCFREQVTDTLVSRHPIESLDQLPQGSSVGTGSPRRQTQLKAQRPDLTFVPIRGNVPTRIDKALTRGEVDAVVVASAALRRLDIQVAYTVELDLGIMLPAPGQGALAVEVRAADARLLDLLSGLDDPVLRICTGAEREFLRRWGGGCRSSVAAYCRYEPTRGFVLDAGVEIEGHFVRTTVTTAEADPVAIARKAASQINSKG